MGREKAEELMVLRLSLGLLALLSGEGDKAAAEAAMRALEGLWVKRSGDCCRASELGSTLDGFRAASASAKRLLGAGARVGACLLRTKGPLGSWK